jgi:predicted RNase H-like HicB family nuclease
VDELVFEVTQDPGGGFSAECLTQDIFTQGETWEELRANVREAVKAFFFDCKERSIQRDLLRMRFSS